jgi:hypothetical protein
MLPPIAMLPRERERMAMLPREREGMTSVFGGFSLAVASAGGGGLKGELSISDLPGMGFFS